MPRVAWRNPAEVLHRLLAPGAREMLIGGAFLAIVATAFLLANRGAYGSFFEADDFDTISWSTVNRVSPVVTWLLSPKVHEANFRPVGAYYYHVLGRAFGLDYRPFVAALHAFHLLNVALVLLILRALKFSPAGIAAGVLFFAFHAATLSAYWQTRFVFDVLCGTFCLLTLLLYIRGRWLLGLVTFVLAYRSKELAVMLPLALAAYEFLAGRGKWKRLLPYFAISLNFGLQALWMNRHRQDTYTLYFTLGVLGQSLRFYLSKILFLPYAGLILVVLPFVVRMWQMFFGLVYMVAMFVPVLFLPRDMFSVFWYVPMLGAAIVIAGVASKEPRFLLTLLLVVWLPLNYQMLRAWRGPVLDASYDTRAYVTAVADLARKSPDLHAVLNLGSPMLPHGVTGVVRFSFRNWVPVYPPESVPGQTDVILKNAPVGVIWWSAYHRSTKTWLCPDPSCLRIPATHD